MPTVVKIDASNSFLLFIPRQPGALLSFQFPRRNYVLVIMSQGGALV